MSKKWLLLLSIIALGFLAGCGDGSNNTSIFPQTVAEVKFIFENKPSILENPLAPGSVKNPDTIITLVNINPNLSAAPIYKVTVEYKGKVIYDKANDWGTYLAHGFTESGKYLLLIREYPAGSYEGISKVFINGDLENLTAAGAVANIKEFDDSWLILVSQVGGLRSAQIESFWSMYNTDTRKLKLF